MKKMIFLTMMVSVLTACSTVKTVDVNAPKVGMANPASQYCIDQGGKLEIKNETNGQIGYCHLPSGETVEEWALFRLSQAKCVPEEAKKLVGITGLSDSQIKQLTKSKIVRRVSPGQPVTMDYREDRVTVTIEATSKKISHASCG